MPYATLQRYPTLVPSPLLIILALHALHALHHATAIPYPSPLFGIHALHALCYVNLPAAPPCLLPAPLPLRVGEEAGQW